MSKIRCQYWDKCYRVNPQHLRDYQHPPGHIAAVRSNITSTARTTAQNTPSQKTPKSTKPSTVSPDLVQLSPESPPKRQMSPVTGQKSSTSRVTSSDHQITKTPSKSRSNTATTTPSTPCSSTATKTPSSSASKTPTTSASKTPSTSIPIPGPDKKSLSSTLSNTSPAPKGHSPAVLANIKATLAQTKAQNGPKRPSTDDESPTSSRKRPCNRETKFDNEGWNGEIDSSRYYLTRVVGHPDHFTNNIALSMRDVLRLEKVTQSWHFSYMVDIDWLLEEYPAESHGSPVTIILGPSEAMALKEQVHSITKGTKQNNKYSYVTIVQAKLPIPYGTHHTKMMVLRSEGGVRIVVHTANLLAQDWMMKTQGMWISPLCKLGEGESNFKNSLLEYLGAYKLPALNALSALLSKYSMSHITVELVASVPGRHSNMTQYGHTRLRSLLSQHVSGEVVRPGWRVISQCSSIGSLGKSSDVWLTGEFAESVGTVKGGVQKPILQLVFPTVECIRNSLEGYCGGSSVPYSLKTHQKQQWLQQYMCHWESVMWGRSRIVPHIKSYCRLSPNKESLAWFLLTSSNLSKAAWGQFEKERTQLMIRSYELGVLFVGPLAVFDRVKDPKSSGIIIPYDVPPRPYAKTDKPWLWDITYTQVDLHGNKWPLNNL